ncbi:MAG: GNAT family N-acetyltransferase [Solirubrobacterales bacterium]|nr:GNAT family N-acetyltransferase [Solirubrobacterales bacterium]
MAGHGAGIVVRSMRLDDAPQLHDLARRAFSDLEKRFGAPRSVQHDSPARVERGIARIRHLVTTDPGGAPVAERGGFLVGASLALLRDGLWGLSLLLVDPRAQSGGLGSQLLRAALDYGSAARGGIILASQDARALRAYARAGLALHPAVEGRGEPHPVASPASVRTGGPDDLSLTETVDRAVRGAAHGPDIQALLESGARMLVVEGRGYAMASGGELRLLAATDEPAAADLLRAFMAGTPAGETAVVKWVTSIQGWALPVLLEARLELRLSGAVFLRGDVGPFCPYLPNGAYL